MNCCVYEDEKIQSFIERQIDSFNSLVFDESKLKKVLKVDAEKKEAKQKNIDRDIEEYKDDLESNIEAKYINSIVKPLVSLEISSSVNAGRDNAIQSIDGIKISKAQWSAVLDDAVCEYCAERDEMIISVDDPDYVNCQPPAHINCRCIWVYITDEERTGDEEEITPDWVSPSQEEKDQHRIFDIYHTDDLNSLVDAYGSKSDYLLHRIQRRIERLQ